MTGRPHSPAGAITAITTAVTVRASAPASASSGPGDPELVEAEEVAAESADPRWAWEPPLAAALLVLVGWRTKLAGGIVLGDCMALVALPMTWTAVRRSRRFSLLLVLSGLAVATGLALSLGVGDYFKVTPSAQRTQLLMAAGMPAAVAAIVWSRERLGLERAAAALGAGMILSNLHLLRSSDNPWKFGLGAAVCIVVLAGVQRYGRGTQLVAATVLGVLYLIHDSRATTGMLMLIVALLIWQIVSAGLTVVEPSPGRLRTHQILLLAGLASAAVVVIVAASLAGYLGQDAQQRTSAQAHGTTNLVLAARPELGASWALITHRPWGYGAGVQPRYEDVSTAMQGMASLNYNPDNGYVRNYMFGHGFELHSGLVDAWIALSLPGAALVAYMIWLALRALWENLGTPRLRSWLLFTVLFVLMNAAVGPLSVLPSYLVLVAAAGLPSAATGRAVPGRSR